MYHRRPVVAGSFYPSNASVLEKEIMGYMKEAGDVPCGGEIVGVLSPHAGYVYSGPVAAYSFKHLVGSGIELVVVLAPSHRARFDGASVIPDGLYETPLGNVEIDSAMGKRLAGMDNFGFIREVHELEHSLEVQVPFIQLALKRFTIVPLIVGTTDLEVCRKLARGIHEALSGETRKFGIVISTDLSHYHAYDAAKEMDGRFIDSLKGLNEEDVKGVLDSRKAEACGEGPVLAGMVLCKLMGAKVCEVFRYANSGDTAGSRDQVVGYLSAAFVK